MRAIASATAVAAIEYGNLLRVGDGVHSMVLRLDPELALGGAMPLLADDGAGGTRISLPGLLDLGVPCFRHGTAIATPHGDVAVETLRPGDSVLTRHGQLRPVRWIGRRSLTVSDLSARPELRPVLVRRGALAEGIPARDLFVSPLHALLVGDVLVPAAGLVNGHSITRATPLGGMEYCHIELDDQALVLAEGTPAETFLDDDSRTMFDNAASFADVDWGARRAPIGPGMRRVESGFQLEAIHQRLAARAGVRFGRAPPGRLRFNVERLDGEVVEGWAVNPSVDDRPVELEVRHGSRVVARLLANRYRADLDRAALAQGRCAFAFALPAGVEMGGLSLHWAVDGMRLAGVG